MRVKGDNKARNFDVQLDMKGKGRAFANEIANIPAAGESSMLGPSINAMRRLPAPSVELRRRTRSNRSAMLKLRSENSADGD